VDRLVWQDATRSPWVTSQDDGHQERAERDGLPACGEPDDALDRVARRVAEREASGLSQLDSLELAFALRAAGAPYVWPHTWTLLTPGTPPGDVPDRVVRFLDSFPDSGMRRCGRARFESRSGGSAFAVVVVDALADLSPLPVRARMGQWLSFDATLRVPATSAKLVVLGPSASPYTVPTTVHDGRVRATWTADHQGPWTAQLVANVSGGPRPVLEALVFADTEPPSAYAEWPAPGEFEFRGDPASAARQMLNDARATEHLPPLRGDPALDRVAAAHARAMKDTRTLAHDTGDGDPVTRLTRASIDTKSAGENVAHALTLRRAHRALWASPSHRGNLLDPRFRALGVGVVLDDDGSLWLCEVFADFAQTGNGQ
jgi:uncharacterized protein YkwD